MDNFKFLEVHANSSALKQFINSLNYLEKEQLPFASQMAMNKATTDSRNHAQDQMKVIFDRPSPFTLNSMWIKTAKKTNLESAVYFREYASKGRAAGKYLAPNVFGTERKEKRSEWLLRQRGILDSNEFLVPSNAAPLDQYGNVKHSEVIKMLSALQATFDTEARSKDQSKIDAYFITGSSTVRTNKPIRKSKAIYRRIGNGVEPLFFIVKGAPHYNSIFKFEEIIRNKFNESINDRFKESFEYAMQTAK